MRSACKSNNSLFHFLVQDFPHFTTSAEEVDLATPSYTNSNVDLATPSFSHDLAMPSFTNSNMNPRIGGGFGTYRILTRSEPVRNLKELDINVRNRWKWGWLNKKHGNGDYLSQYVKKIDQPGIALCTWCPKQITYGSSGKKAILKHAETENHLHSRKANRDSKKCR